MKTKADELVEKNAAIVSTIAALRDTVAALDMQTDQLGQAITELEDLLQVIKPGVAAWATIAVRDGVNGWSRAIGYTKINGRWSLALRERKKEGETENVWAFNEAARWMRVEAAAHIPELFAALVQRTMEMSEAMSNRTQQVRAIAGLVRQGIEDGAV